jgi:hypothetical protein
MRRQRKSRCEVSAHGHWCLTQSQRARGTSICTYMGVVTKYDEYDIDEQNAYVVFTTSNQN